MLKIYVVITMEKSMLDGSCYVRRIKHAVRLFILVKIRVIKTKRKTIEGAIQL